MENLFVIEGDARSWDEAIELCCAKLQKEGIVEASFCQACIEREKVFPTGLPTPLGVAIPHADSGLVKTDGICFLRLKNQVTFQRLDDPEQSVGVNYVINLATKNPDEHIHILQRVMAFAQDPQKLNYFLNASLDEMKRELRVYLAV